jgi:hypothetical protein
MKNTSPIKKLSDPSVSEDGFSERAKKGSHYLKASSASVAANIINSQQLILDAQRELAIARRMRIEAQRYLRETKLKAKSEAQQLVLQARMTVHEEIEKLVDQANEEIRKALADFRVIRITAQEELAAQKKFVDAARLRYFTLSLQEDEVNTGREDTKKDSPKKPSSN